MTNIKEINLSTGKWLAVQVPKNQSYFDLFGNNSGQYLQYNVMTNPGKFKPITIPLPAGHTYTLIGKASELTEKDWKKIVERSQPKFGGAKVQIAFYKAYGINSSSVAGATASGLTLLAAYGLNPQTTILIQQQ